MKNPIKYFITRSVQFSMLMMIAVNANALDVFGIESVTVTDIHSFTFEGALANPSNDFIPTPDPSKTEVTFTPAGTANGGSTSTGEGILAFDGNKLVSGSLLLPDMDVFIAGGGGTNVNTSGATINLTSPATDNTSNQFQQDGGSNIIADFSVFTDVTTDCAGAGCVAITLLNLDGLKYEIEGEVTAGGGDTLTLTLETDNTSVLVLEIVTKAVTEFAGNIASVTVTDIHSFTFEGALANPSNDFIPTPDPSKTEVTFTEAGTANGGSTETGAGYIVYDGDKLSVGSLLLPDMDVFIAGGGGTNVNTSGATISLTSPATDNTSNQFQQDGGSNIIADFSVFTDVTTDCAGAGCVAITLLNLDGLKYEIEGEVTAGGGDTLTLTLETDNTSVLVLEIVTVENNGDESGENVPYPAFAVVFLAALLGLTGYKKAKDK